MSSYQTGYAQPSPTPQPPPRKRRTWLIVLIVILVISGLGFAACVATVGSIGKAMNESAASGQPYEQRSEPREVTPGKEFTIGSHKTLAGWKIVKEDDLGEGMFNVQGKVTNVSDATSTAFLHFKIINSDNEVIGNVQCNSGDLEPGQTQTLNCIPEGEYGKYTKITAEATF